MATKNPIWGLLIRVREEVEEQGEGEEQAGNKIQYHRLVELDKLISKAIKIAERL